MRTRSRPVVPFAAVVIGLLALLAGCSTLNAVSALLGNQVVFSQPQLQQSLDRNFPKRYDKLGGLVALSLMNPRLSIPPGSNRLRLDFDVGLGALGSDASRPDGRFALTSALRFDPATRGLHLQDPVIESVDVPALGGVMGGGARQLPTRWLGDYARHEPVYRFDNSLLDRLGARRIGSTEIQNGQVVVNLGQ